MQQSDLKHILNCGDEVNWWVKLALGYLSSEIINGLTGRIAIYCMSNKDGCRLPRQYCEHRDIVIISERIVPPKGVAEDNKYARYFIHTVLHEIAHAFKKHRSPALDKLEKTEVDSQEREADDLATLWFNAHVEHRCNPHLKPITEEELEPIRSEYQRQMKERYG